MKMTKIVAAALSVGLLAGCSPFQTEKKYFEDTYVVDVSVYDTEASLEELSRGLGAAVQGHDGKSVGEYHVFWGNDDSIMQSYGVKSLKLQSVDYLRGNAEVNEEVILGTRSLKPLIVGYENDNEKNRDYVSHESFLTIKIEEREYHNMNVTFDYRNEKLVSLDDVSTEQVFVPLKEGGVMHVKNSMTLPEKKDGVTIVNVSESYGKNKVFVMTIERKQHFKDRAPKNFKNTKESSKTCDSCGLYDRKRNEF